MSRVIPPRTVTVGRVSGLLRSSFCVLTGRFAELFRPADAGRTDQTDQTDVRSISGSGRLDLCVLVNDMFFPVSDAASVAGQWLAAGVLTMADLFGIPWQLLAVSVIYTVIYTTANVGHGVLWLCVRLRAAAAGCEWSASSGSAFCRRGGRGCGGTTCRHFSPHSASPPPAAAAAPRAPSCTAARRSHPRGVPSSSGRAGAAAPSRTRGTEVKEQTAPFRHAGQVASGGGLALLTPKLWPHQ